MKLLKQYSSEVDAEHLSSRLRNKSVMTYVSSKRSHSIGKFQSGAIYFGVWVVLKNQYADAFELLKNKRHVVAHPLTKEEMAKFESTTRKSFHQSISQGLAKIGTMVLVCLLGGFVLCVAYSFVKNA